MTKADRQTPNAFANQGRPAFAGGGNGARKLWAIICTIGFAIFWISGLFLVAELFGERDLTVWPMILTPLGFAIGMLGRVMMSRE